MLNLLNKQLPDSELFAYTTGPQTAETMIVGESWGEMEEAKRLPFVGTAGTELDRLLSECGMNRADCLVANVFNFRPPMNEMWRRCVPMLTAKEKHIPETRGLHLDAACLSSLEKLYQLIRKVKPKRILAFGNYAFWALSTECRISTNGEIPVTKVPTGIGDFRGSMLYVNTTPELESLKIHLLPLVHPAAYLRNWEQRAITVHDLRTRVPMSIKNDWVARYRQIIHRPTFYEMVNYFKSRIAKMDAGTKLYFANDIETRKRLITCQSFSDDRNFAIVMPFISAVEEDGSMRSYWSLSQEADLLRLMSQMLTHPNAMVVGQNYIYDTWYYLRSLGIKPRLRHDTLLAQHLIWPGTPKDLGYLSSIYCQYHRYWKDDNKEWSGKTSIDSHLKYNGEDSMRTLEIAQNQRDVIRQVGKDALWDLEMEKNDLALEMSVRGVRIDMGARDEARKGLESAKEERISRLLSFVPQEAVDWLLGKKQKSRWVTSPTQQKAVFSEFFGIAIPKNRKTGKPSLDKENLPKLAQKYPHFAPVFEILLELRSIGVFLSTFVEAEVDFDGRMRTSFNPAGTETFRWSSQANPFGAGCNFQNLPKGNEE